MACSLARRSDITVAGAPGGRAIGMRPALFRSKIRYLALHQSPQSARAYRTIVRLVATLHIIAARIRHPQNDEEGASWRAVLQAV